MKKKYYCIDCDKEIWCGSKRCKSCSRKGKLNYSYNEERHQKHYCITKGCNNEICLANWYRGTKRCRECADKNAGKLRIGTKRLDLSKYNKKRKGIFKHTKETIEKIKKSLKHLWQNKKYRENTIKAQRKGMKVKPNKPEKLLNKLLNNLFPKEYKFVGDGKIILGGFNPDFININGQKKIIELYGDYWHNRPDSKSKHKRRINAYKKFGYKTLIIWEHELKKIDKTKQKIMEFNSPVPK